MKILKLRLCNLNSIRNEVELDFSAEPFNQSGLFAITGDTGAGKSTLLDAMTLALFGRTSRSHEGEVMSYGSKEAWAEVEFAAGGAVFRAKWQQQKDKKDVPKTPYRELSQQDNFGNFEILATGKTKLDGVKDEKGLIELKCGLNYDQFRRSVMLAQGEFATFLKANEKERSALLERLTDTEIYSRISIAAFQRHKKEEEALDRLTQQRNLLQLLTPDEINERISDQKQAEANALQLGVELEQLRKNHAWIIKIQQLETQIQTLQADLVVLEAERDSITPAINRLELHRKTMPFQADLARLHDFEETTSHVEKEMGDLLQQQERLAEKIDVLTQLRDEKQAYQKNLASEQEAFDRIATEVLELDIKLDNRNAQLIKLVAEMEAGKGKFEALSATVTAKTSELTQHESALRNIQNWLDAYPQAKDLAKDYLIADQKYIDNLRQIFKEQTALKKGMDENIANLLAVEITMPDVQQAVTEIEAAIALAKAELQQLCFDQHLPEDVFLAIGELEKRVEASAKTLQSLEDFARQQVEYKATLQELGNIREDHASLLTEDYVLGKDLLNAIYLLADLEESVTVKRNRYEREIMLVNYERDRENLQPKEACPLCGATEHPYRLNQPSVFVDDAKKEFEKVMAQFEQVKKQQQNLVNRHLQIQQQIGTAHELMEEFRTEEMKKLDSRIREQEIALQRALPVLGDEAEMEANEAYFTRKIADVQHQIALLKQTKERINNILRQTADLEKSHSNAKNVLQQQQLKRDLLKKDIQNDENQYANLQEQYTENENSVNGILHKYGVTFSPSAEFGLAFSKLKEQALTFEKHTADKNVIQQRLGLLNQEITQLSNQTAEKGKELTQKQQEMEQISAEIAQIGQQRKTLFGDKDIKVEKEILASKTQAIQKDLKEILEEMQQNLMILASLQANTTEKKQRLAYIQTKSGKIRSSISQQLQSKGFADWDTLMNAILPEADSVQIEAQIADLTRRETEYAQSIRDTQAALSVAQNEKFEFIDHRMVEQQLHALQDNLEQNQQKIGGIKAALKADEARKVQSKELLLSLHAQKREVERWAKLKDMIGSADGAAFRKFAQSLTLEQLILHANQHLNRLNGRYLIRRKSDKDLDLQIVDTFQADNVRSMNTLSGGETFLASLALALGLSDLAGRKTQIHSLFIDEGFGALDENALELAITTLENLQARGTMIGIISHINALKERISIQIKVKKNGNGYSTVEVVS